MGKFWVFFFCFFALLGPYKAFGNVILIGKNVTLSFEETGATFAQPVKGFGICGTLHMAEPLDACSPLTNNIVLKTNCTKFSFVLIIREGCNFEEKVRRAQAAGFKAAIIYDSEDGDLVAMEGNSDGIKIYAVFVSKVSGETLSNYAGVPNTELWLAPSFECSAGLIMAIAFVSLFAVAAFLSVCLYYRRHHTGRARTRVPCIREFHGISSRLVKAMPSLIFSSVSEDNSTSSTCAICLEDYNVGEMLRILPCLHKFHAFCVDAWLTSWRTFCPVCKCDTRINTGDPPASEFTPLLSSSPASVYSSSALSSIRSPIASSSAIRIAASSSHSPSVSCPRSIFSSPYHQQLLQSYHQSPCLSTSRNSVDLRDPTSQRSGGAYLVSPHSLGYPSLSPVNSRYMSPYIPSPINASSSYFGSSSHLPNPLHYSESASGFSPFSSSQSLAGC
ncbi:unnamed protein product [Fraxinus pennsylvanica]|uniref:RING-type domain-containing protein n=1 Tax=Fraxinus pennsylvanica TaxID=56036 RepID=A0AAD2DJP2_9LAMI|nr:unnamed protein product [Fraxinus pennsylvanica]